MFDRRNGNSSELGMSDNIVYRLFIEYDGPDGADISDILIRNSIYEMLRRIAAENNNFTGL